MSDFHCVYLSSTVALPPLSLILLHLRLLLLGNSALESFGRTLAKPRCAGTERGDVYVDSPLTNSLLQDYNLTFPRLLCLRANPFTLSIFFFRAAKQHPTKTKNLRKELATPRRTMLETASIQID
ncbi:hypothetical protein B296_00003013 [Ensete ventricosum]|uniref:Uncharacterized protein n=1 Tax=Ensete ventricosum TaxID=4639 RepID=A0A427AXV9_ENSVE|nr:hypothetical protein B296_00003013 [Ensete ventricosum]